jgi:hypothetical protein
MTSDAGPAEAFSRKAREAARPRRVPRPLRPWVVRVARVGLAAKAAVYLTLGVLAAKAAVGWGGRTTDTRGAIEALSRQGGSLIALAVALGLLSYAAWRAVEAVADTDHDGSGWKGIRSRAAALGSAAAHVTLAMTAFAVAAGIHARRSGSVPAWTATVLHAPAGALLVAAAGVIVLVVGGFQFRKAFRADFCEKEHVQARRMGPLARTWVLRLGRFGLTARGITFGIVGFFLVRAGLHRDPGEARGVDGALRFLRGLEHGDIFLAAVALGVVAYGVYTLLLARYRRLEA